MLAALQIGSFVVSGVAVIPAAWIGALLIKEVRRKTGDDSFLTSLLIGELFHR